MNRHGKFKGKKNIYMCRACGQGFVSQDVDSGVTPFATACLNQDCEELAQSFMYSAPQALLADLPAAIEWYLPADDELAKLSRYQRNHVENGGLISRRTKGGDA